MNGIVLIIGAAKPHKTPKQQLRAHVGAEAVHYIHKHLNKEVSYEQAQAMWENMNEFNREIALMSYRLVKQRSN